MVDLGLEGPDGVKLREMVLFTESGAPLLAPPIKWCAADVVCVESVGRCASRPWGWPAIVRVL